ncbi:MAG: hypothetical protein WCX17_02830 [Parcubacteria group bacterium]
MKNLFSQKKGWALIFFLLVFLVTFSFSEKAEAAICGCPNNKNCPASSSCYDDGYGNYSCYSYSGGDGCVACTPSFPITINSFYASPPAVLKNTSTTLYWSTSGSGTYSCKVQYLVYWLPPSYRVLSATATSGSVVMDLDTEAKNVSLICWQTAGTGHTTCNSGANAKITVDVHKTETNSTTTTCTCDGSIPGGSVTCPGAGNPWTSGVPASWHNVGSCTGQPCEYTTPAPTCSISYSPGTITSPGSSTATVTMNNVTSATYGCTGPQPVASGSGLGVAASATYVFTFPAGQTGTETCTASVSGPGGSSSCSGSVVVNAPANQDPEGGVESGGTCTNGTIHLWGWAIDRDALTTSIPVHFYEGGTYKGQCNTTTLRSDINTAYGTTGNHGFDCYISGFSAGNHTITTYAINTPAGNNPALPWGTNPQTVNCPVTDCALPWGGTLANGSSVTAYQASSVPCGSTCTSQTRTCNSGTLSGTYTSQTCSVSGCLSCNRPCGGSTISGNWGALCYQSASVPCGSSCSSSQGYCNNGLWTTPYAAGSTAASCSVAACVSCASPCGLSATTSGNWGPFCYLASSVPCGSSCSSSQGYCFNGNWITPYTAGSTAASCSVAACPTCTLPWGGTIANGSSVTAYQNSSVACGSSCVSQTRTCNSGVLSGTYTNQNCSVAACSCNLPWGGTLANGSSVTAYQASSVPCGSSCSSQTRTCNSGVLSGSYTSQTCSVAGCTSCVSPCGLAATASGNWGAFCYLAGSVPCGSNCLLIASEGYCQNGVWTTPYAVGATSGSCSVAACASCVLPWGGSIPSGNNVVAYQASSVPCGSSCSPQVRTCTNGFLSGSYANQNCSATGCLGCTAPWGTAMVSGGAVTACQSASVPCGSSCACETRTCTNGVLSGSFTVQGPCSVQVCDKNWKEVAP